MARQISKIIRKDFERYLRHYWHIRMNRKPYEMLAVNISSLVVYQWQAVSKLQKEHLLCMYTSASWVDREDFKTCVLCT